ncbi:MAG TPA: hypothetical protein VEW07_04935, partial [Solirubrobacterales bacterium]|nr:hypothetical protein [Solirubrobacterales bacterium]
AEAEAVAAAAAEAAPYSPRWYELRKAVRAAVKKAIEPVLKEKIRPTSTSLLESALETLDKMIDPKAGE